MKSLHKHMIWSGGSLDSMYAKDNLWASQIIFLWIQAKAIFLKVILLVVCSLMGNMHPFYVKMKPFFSYRKENEERKLMML